MGGDDGGGDGTHRNATQFVVSQSASRQQVVFALLAPSCQHEFGTTCNKLDGNIRRLS